MLNTLKSRLLPDWQWVVSFSWSVRLIMLACILSIAEAVMPFFTPLTHQPLYALATGLITGAALIARVIVQKRIYDASTK
jgi:hypothetical protein